MILSFFMQALSCGVDGFDPAYCIRSADLVTPEAL
jgi:hypothetical protein